MTSPVPHQAIYRRWRAQTFREIVGQEAVVETLRNAVRTERVSHAILFVGPRGTGKTSLARILAKALNCTNLQDGDACDTCPSCVAIREGTTLDLVEIDAASNRGIDEVRTLRERLAYPPGELLRKVYILDEAHQITAPAWNALLKSVEEPPDYVNFMFASTEPSKFPPAILSRLQRYDVRRLTTGEIEGKLSRILEADGRTADPAAIHLIARLAAGGMRDAESMLDQLLSSAPESIDEARVRDLLGLADADAVDGFVAALVAGDAATGIALLDTLEERGRDARVLLDQTIEVIRARMVESLSSGQGSMTPGLTEAARRLAAIDPDRAGVGGLRLQLELALFAGPSAPAAPVTRRAEAAVPVVAAPVVSSARPTPRAATPSAKPSEPDPFLTAAPVAAEPSPVSTAASPASAAGVPDPAGAPAPGAERTPEVPPPDAAVSGDDLARLQDHWPEIVASVGPATKAVITECRPMAVDGNVVTLGFPETRAFLKDQAERKRPELEAAFGAFLGRPVAVRAVATNIEIPPPMAPDEVIAEAGRIFADMRVDVGEVS